MEFSGLTTGERIRRRREARGMSRAVVAGLVGRSTDWLKKIERDERQLRSLPLLLQLASVLGVSDLSELTGQGPLPVSAWARVGHPVVPEIRRAMHEVSFGAVASSHLTPDELHHRVHAAWLLWHSSPRQRTEVGALLPDLIRQAHACVRTNAGQERRRAGAAAGDLYRLVQRLLAHICEPELHALAVERGRVMSEEADTPLARASATWSSAVSLCASGHYEDAVQLVNMGTDLLQPLVENGSPQAMGMYGALQLEAAAAYGLAGRDGDAFRYLDAAEETARRLPDGYWHPQTAFERGNVQILSVIVNRCLRKTGTAISAAARIDLPAVPSALRRSRLLLEIAEALADRREFAAAVSNLEAAARISTEAVALIPWARSLADELEANTTGLERRQASELAARFKSVDLA
ncbi:XRE family transcriptional regulator [Nocardia cyriacigeorgica]|uniref:XRE family transcriptional regulator n=2 Tax=Nocardia cyriacigeorgica TaxID=135487 RepID=A0A5R8NZW0_9NOCA|nr:XRE family transcriptional regulator [Nocardia cyriacigeorgica]